MWKDVYADFSDLPRREQKKLFNLIKEEFFSDDEEEMKDAITAIRETRFNEGLACVHCGCVKVKRNGKYRKKAYSIFSTSIAITAPVSLGERRLLVELGSEGISNQYEKHSF